MVGILEKSRPAIAASIASRIEQIATIIPDLFGDEPQRSPVVGTLVKLDRTIDRVRPCHQNTCVVGAGAGPHGASLICSCCGQHRGWLSKSTLAFLERGMRLCGRVDGLPIVRNTEEGGEP
jgi:hypothetical protein